MIKPNRLLVVAYATCALVAAATFIMAGYEFGRWAGLLATSCVGLVGAFFAIVCIRDERDEK